MQIYKVGGAVRDKLLGLASHDVDWVVVGATAEQMEELGYLPVGKDFPVFLHPKTKEEYALARTERKSGHGYKGFQLYTDPSVTLEQDLQRRDLTINALAEDAQGTIIDPYQGQRDIEQRCLRHISPAFAEDPLRVLRVARFAARLQPLGFTVAPQTLQLMREISDSGELQHLTAERVWQELERALGEAEPQTFLQVLDDCGALAQLFPELAAVWTSAEQKRALAALNCARDQGYSATVRLAVLCYFIDSERYDLTAFLDRIKAPNAVKTLCTLVHQQGRHIPVICELSAEQQLQLYRQLDIQRRPERLPRLIAAARALAGTAPHEVAAFEQRLLDIRELISDIDPKQLMAEGFKGKRLGEELQRRQLERLSQSTSN